MPHPSFYDGKETVSFTFSFGYMKDVTIFVIFVFGGATTRSLFRFDFGPKFFFNEVVFI